MKLRIVMGVGVALVFVILSGCNIAGQKEAPSASAEVDRAPTASNDDPVERGKTAYFKHCVACHSPDTDEYVAGIALKGYFNNAPTELSDGTVFPRTDEAIRELVEDGTTDMPPLIKGITPQELDDILVYLHTL